MVTRRHARTEGVHDMDKADDVLDPPERSARSAGERREPDVTKWPDASRPLITLTVSYPLPAVCVVEVAGDIDAAGRTASVSGSATGTC